MGVRVILLLGSSGAGKSTLCHGVEALTRPKWKIRDTDTFGKDCIGQAVEAFSKKHDIKGLLSDLAMSPDQIVNLAMTGKLKGGHSITHQFENPELTDVDQVLKELKIPDSRIPALAVELRNVVKNRAELEDLIPKPNQEFLNRFFEKIFSETFGSDDTLVIDVNPHPGVGPAIISKLMDQHIEQYSKQHEQLIESFKVLAYCPPEIQSDRMHRRMKDKKDDDYMGEGIFPFQQAAMLVGSHRAEEKSESTHTKRDTIGELSRKSVFDIANKNIKYSKDAPLIIVDTVEPTVMQSPEVKELDSSVSEMPLVAPKPVVEAYHFLADKFGFLANETRIKLSVTRDFQCDVIIDTSKQNANDMVNEINRLTQTRAAKYQR